MLTKTPSPAALRQTWQEKEVRQKETSENLVHRHQKRSNTISHPLQIGLFSSETQVMHLKYDPLLYGTNQNNILIILQIKRKKLRKKC